jgi:hypothetical protein
MRRGAAAEHRCGPEPPREDPRQGCPVLIHLCAGAGRRRDQLCRVHRLCLCSNPAGLARSRLPRVD